MEILTSDHAKMNDLEKRLTDPAKVIHGSRKQRKRGWFKDKYNDIVNEIEDQGEENVDQGNDIWNEIEEEGEEIVDKGHDIKNVIEEKGEEVVDGITHLELAVKDMSGKAELELDLHPSAVDSFSVGPDLLQTAKIGIPGLATVGPALQNKVVVSASLADPLKLTSGIEWGFARDARVRFNLHDDHKVLISGFEPHVNCLHHTIQLPRWNAFNLTVAFRTVLSLQFQALESDKLTKSPALVFVDPVKMVAMLEPSPGPCPGQPGEDGSWCLTAEFYTTINWGMDISFSPNLDPSLYWNLKTKKWETIRKCFPKGDPEKGVTFVLA